MIRRSIVVLLSLLALAAWSRPSLARDKLATGYTATSGVFAGLWVAQ